MNVQKLSLTVTNTGKVKKLILKIKDLTNEEIILFYKNTSLQEQEKRVMVIVTRLYTKSFRKINQSQSLRYFCFILD